MCAGVRRAKSNVIKMQSALSTLGTFVRSVISPLTDKWLLVFQINHTQSTSLATPTRYTTWRLPRTHATSHDQSPIDFNDQSHHSRYRLATRLEWEGLWIGTSHPFSPYHVMTTPTPNMEEATCAHGWKRADIPCCSDIPLKNVNARVDLCLIDSSGNYTKMHSADIVRSFCSSDAWISALFKGFSDFL